MATTTRTRTSHTPRKTLRSDVPLAVWPVAQTSPQDPRAGLCHPGSTALAARIIEEYTSPGQLVIDPMCGIGTTLVEAAARDRRIIGVALDDDSARTALATCEQNLTPEQCLAVDVRVGGARHLSSVLHDAIGQADLVLVCAPAGSRGNKATTDDYRGCRRLLRPGGLLVTVTTNTRRKGRTLDLAGRNVAMARAAGFTYMQHVIALRAAIRDGELVVSTTPSEPRTGRARPSREPGHLVVHDDVVVFRAETEVGR